MSKYPNIESLKLVTFYGSLQCAFGGSGPTDYVCARDLEAILAKGVRVYGGTDVDRNGEFLNPFCNGEHLEYDTHQALLIDIKPIQKPDSYEKLAADLAAWAARHELIAYKGDPPDAKSLYAITERAKKLIEKGEG